MYKHADKFYVDNKQGWSDRAMVLGNFQYRGEGGGHPIKLDNSRARV